MSELIRVWEDSGFKLELFDTGRTNEYWGSPGKSVLGYRFYDGSELMFERENFHCSPLHAIDSDATLASLLGFLSLKPGDTDSEYFMDYTPVQLAWCRRRGEELGILAYELEESRHHV